MRETALIIVAYESYQLSRVQIYWVRAILAKQVEESNPTMDHCIMVYGVFLHSFLYNLLQRRVESGYKSGPCAPPQPSET
jgi:hypothetical protein